MDSSQVGSTDRTNLASRQYGRASDQQGVYICLLNWNGWRDTIECLESLLLLEYRDFRVVVCDNDSSDDSCDRLRAWFLCNAIRFVPAMDTSGGSPESYFTDIGQEAAESLQVREQRCIFIRNTSNLGFAAGNNVALRLAIRQADCGFVWLLNNDTVVTPRALTALVEEFRKEPRFGICGSRLVFYHARDRVQALCGGAYNRWFSIAKHVGEGMTLEESERVRTVSVAYPCAASMLVSRRFIEVVGMMAEDYFLYFEELDWMQRAGNRFMIGYAADSLVFHKEGQAIGSDGHAEGRSVLSDYYLTRSRFVFTRKYYPYALPTLCIWLAIMSLARLRRHGWTEGGKRAHLVLLAAWDGIRGGTRVINLPNKKAAARGVLGH